VPLLMSTAGARARAAQRYGVALGSALLALAAHMLLHRQFGPSLDPLLVLIVGASAWYGGFGPGLATLALVAGGTLFVGAAGTGAANGTQRSELLWLVVYGLSGLVLSALIAWLRAAQRYADRAREQVAFLSEVSEVLASSLDFRATLSAAARLAVPRLADWCAVDVIDTDGRLRRLAIAHTNPAMVDAVWAMSHKYREHDEDPVPQVIRTARTQLIPEIPLELLRRFARDEEHLQALRAFGLRSLLIVPLTARGRTLGAITFVMAESERRYGPADQRLGEDMARRAAIAVDNARLYQEAEAALLEKDRTVALLDTVFRGAPIGLAFVDRGLRFVRVNDALAAINGAPVDAHLGRTVDEVLGAKGGPVSALFEAVFRDGAPILDHEMHSESHDGIAARTFLASYYPVSAPDGRIEWVGCLVSDVTERRRAAALQLQAERMEAIARVAGGVAHEVNNMMTVITGFSGFLEGALPSDDPRAEDVAEIQRAADRAAGITRQLLAYSRQQMLHLTRVDLKMLVQQAVPALARLLGPGVRIDVAQADTVVPVRADHAQLVQVLVNLALNARDAMGGAGRFTLSAETVELAPDQRAPWPGVVTPPGRYARLSVSDSGHGMDAATRARIFEPFFTTKASGQGSGLGLATVYGIVKQIGGYIWVYSEVGQGTVFKIYLPEFTGPVVEVPPADRLTSPRGAETILIVEDERAVRRMAARALAAQGYTILEAENGAEALEMLARDGSRVDLVLSDVVMPMVNGRELGERLAAERPGLRLLYMSGYTDDDIIRRGLLRPGAPFLQKPFMPDDLSRKVREVLDT
jgi:two-component system, cell cycle sensor histidine kinase and response regulator CckA